MQFTGYLTAPASDGTRDVTAGIQRLINENPHRTIFFPDGVYRISSPILTPADPAKSVALLLSDFAVIQASEDWRDEEAMIRLGGKDPFNSITINGSNYGIAGGIMDAKRTSAIFRSSTRGSASTSSAARTPAPPIST